MISSKPDIPTASIVGVTFGHFTSEEVERRSAVEINEGAILLNPEHNNVHGVMDTAMGTTERSKLCKTCLCDSVDCQGHEGHIRLVRPFYNNENIDQQLKIHKAVCYYCSRKLVRPNHPEYKRCMEKKGLERLKSFADVAVKIGKCPDPPPESIIDSINESNEKEWNMYGCGREQPSYSRGTLDIEAWIGDQKGTIEWSSEIAYAILDGIPDNDVHDMDIDPKYSHPRTWMIPTNFSVCPPAIRPPLMQDEENIVGNDDFSAKIKIISTLNQKAQALESWMNCIASEIPIMNPLSSLQTSQKTDSKTSRNGQPSSKRMKILQSNTPFTPILQNGLPEKIYLCCCACPLPNRSMVRFRPCGCRCIESWTSLKAPKAPCACRQFAAHGSSIFLNHSQHDDEQDEKMSNEPSSSAPVSSANMVLTIGTKPPNVLIQNRKQALLLMLKHIFDDLLHKIQYELSTYFHNPIKGEKPSTHRNGKPYQAIVSRHQGKSGRFRGSVLGKRGNNGGRTVASGHPAINVDEVGLPLHMAMSLTYPETVTKYNIDKMYNLVRNGPDVYPGANIVIDGTGRKIDLAAKGELRNQIVLEYGWKVERHIVDGDIAICNRQPSLHKYSMLGHVVKVVAGKALLFNDAVTHPYGLDFDGDEEMIIIIRDERSKAEIKYLMKVNNHIISSRTNSTLIHPIQDAVTGIYRLTEFGVFLKKEQVDQIICQAIVDEKEDGYLMNVPEPAVRVKNPKTGQWESYWTGKQVFAHLLPVPITMEKGDMSKLQQYMSSPEPLSNHDNDDRKWSLDFHELERTTCKILHGHYILGRVKKSELSEIIRQVVYLRDGQTASNFITGLNRAAHWYIMHAGLTACLADCVNPCEQETNEIWSSATQWVNQHFSAFDKPSPEEEKIIGQVTSEAFSRAKHKFLTAIRKNATIRRNHMLDMSDCGAKGTDTHLAQMAVGVGQQIINGSRPFHAMSCFSKRSGHAKAHGCITRPYAQGVLPEDYVHLASAGQEGLVSTGVKTAATGDLARQVMKRSENLKVHYDGTVRNAQKKMFQLLYGDDGYEGSFMIKVKFPALQLDNHQLEQQYSWFLSSRSWNERMTPEAQLRWKEQLNVESHRLLLEQEWKLLQESRDAVRLSKQILSIGIKWSDELCTPIPFIPFLEMSKLYKNKQCLPSQTDLTPFEIYWMVQSTWNRWVQLRLVMTPFCFHKPKDQQVIHPSHSTLALFRDYCCSKRLFDHWCVDSHSLPWLLAIIERRFAVSKAAAGEMVGASAAHGVTEPATQMTLDTHRQVGFGQKVSLGFPRIKEITNAVESVKHPTMKIALKQQDPPLTMAQVRTLANQWEEVMLDQLVSESSFTTSLTYLDNTASSSLQHQHSVPWLVPRFAFLLSEYTTDSQSNQVVVVTPSSSLLGVKQFGDVYSIVGAHLNLNKTVCQKYLLSPWSLIQRLQTLVSSLDPFSTNHFWIYSQTWDQDWIIQLYLDKSSSIYHELSQQHNHIPDGFEREREMMFTFAIRLVQSIRIQGIEGIKQTFPKLATTVRFNSETGARQDIQQWIVETNGSNLSAILKQPFVDNSQTTTNNIFEMEQLFGITTSKIWTELQIANVFDFSGTYCDARHIQLVTRILTHGGKSTSMTRSYNRSMQVCEKAAIDKPTKHINAAAQTGSHDPIEDVSSCIMMGKTSSIGTGSMNVKIDSNYLGKCLRLERQKWKHRTTSQIAPLEIVDMTMWQRSVRGFNPIRYSLPPPSYFNKLLLGSVSDVSSLSTLSKKTTTTPTHTQPKPQEWVWVTYDWIPHQHQHQVNHPGYNMINGGITTNTTISDAKIKIKIPSTNVQNVGHKHCPPDVVWDWDESWV